MRVDPLCTVIRFAPIGVLFAVHCSGGRWPSDDECAARVMQYGFCVDGFRLRPASVVTHLFVHISSDHLLSNAFSFAATLLEFGSVPSRADAENINRHGNANHTNDADEDAQEYQGRGGSGRGGGAGGGGNSARPSSSSPSSLSRLSSNMYALWGEHSPIQACLRSAGAVFVWVIGGALGGLGGQVLYNDYTLALRRERATRAALAVQQTQRAMHQQDGDGGHYVTRLVQHVHALWQRAQALNAQVAVDAQEAANDSMMVCGASAGICALSGFSAVYYGRPITACCLVVPEMVALGVDLVNRYVALLVPENASSWSAGGVGDSSSSDEARLAAQRKVLRSTWRTLMPGQTVGHAAHVGGFIVGAGLGYLWLWAQKRRLAKAQARRRAAA